MQTHLSTSLTFMAKKAAKKKVAKVTVSKSKVSPEIWKAAEQAASMAGPLGTMGAKAARGLASMFGYGAYRQKSARVKRLKGSSPMKMASIRGRGDYTSTGTPGAAGLGVPQFTNAASSSNGNIRFAHREYLQDIISTTTFTNQAYAIQPALSSSFPFLGQIASAFEQYRFHGLVFYYRTMSGTAVGSTSTALGSIVMATQYDSLSPAFTTKSEMENYQFAVSGVPCYDLQHMIECAPKETPVKVLYTRTGGIPSGADERLYDLGTFNLATAGMQSASNNVVGELWVSYDVELIKPRVPSGAGLAQALTDHFQGVIASVSSTNYLGTSVTAPTASSTIQGTWNPTSNTYTFPNNFTDGLFMFTYACTGASTTLTTAVAVTIGSNIAAQNFWTNDVSSMVRNNAGAVSPTQFLCYTFKFNGGVTPGQSFITISAGTLPGTVTGADLFITVLGPGLVSTAEGVFNKNERPLADKIRASVRAEMIEMLSKAGIDMKLLEPPKVSPIESKDDFVSVEDEIIELQIKKLQKEQDARIAARKQSVQSVHQDFEVVPTPKKR